MYRMPPPLIVQGLRDQYPQGTRVKLIEMSDPYSTLSPGDLGTVIFVDDTGSIHIQWDKGSSLAALYGIDHIRKI